MPCVFLVVLEKTEETAASNSELAPQESSSSKVLSSSPVSESALPSERWAPDSSAQPENRTCDEQQTSALNCDVLNFQDTTCISDDACKTELSPILESDSMCRTVQDEQSVDPVYL